MRGLHISPEFYHIPLIIWMFCLASRLKITIDSRLQQARNEFFEEHGDQVEINCFGIVDLINATDFIARQQKSSKNRHAMPDFKKLSQEAINNYIRQNIEKTSIARKKKK